MEAQEVILHNKGMYQDSSISKSSNEFAFENYGIRITGELDNTLLSVTNEKGPKLVGAIDGTYLGHCILGKYLIIFTTLPKNGNEPSKDYIYKYSIEEGISILYSGNLNFDIEHPIESFGWYESEDIQKVYWIDGKNYPRFINIVGNIKPNNDYQFDFYTHINKLPKVEIEKDYTQSGMFSQGTIQYFITYYNKYGAETPIIWQSAIQYISLYERGAKADENVNCAFNISIKDVDPTFDYIRIYSAQRTDNNSPVLVKLVTDIKIPSKEYIENFEEWKEVTRPNGLVEKVKSNVFRLYYTDMGTTGEVIDPNLIYYIGGMSVVPSTMTQKDGTLFLGNLNISKSQVSQELKDYFNSRICNINSNKPSDIRESPDIIFSTKRIEKPNLSGFYSHTQQINHSQYNIATFKCGEIYRFAIQFMTLTGEWTIPIWIGDKVCNIRPKDDIIDNYYSVANAIFVWPKDLTPLVEGKYVSYRLLMAETNIGTRSILAQGVVSPTLFNYYERFNNAPNSIASWNFRLRNSNMSSAHLQSIGNQYSETAELQGLKQELMPLFNLEESDFNTYKYYNLIFGIDSGTEMVYKLILFNIPDNKVKDYAEGKYIIPTSDYKEIVNGRQDKSTWNKVINAVYDDLNTTCESFMQTSNTPIQGVPITKSQMPSKKEIKDILYERFGTAIWASIASAIVVAAGIALTVVSWGTASGPAAVGAATAVTAIWSAITTMGASIAAITAGASLTILGSAGIASAILNDKNASKTVKEMAKKGWIYYGTIGAKNENEDPQNILKKQFSGISNFVKFQGSNNGSFWMTGGRLSFKKTDEIIADSRKEQYYVDNSVVTLNSPDLEDNQDVINNNQALGFRIVGIVPVESVATDYTIETETPGFENFSEVIKHNKSLDRQLFSKDTEGLLNGYLYQDTNFESNTPINEIYRQKSIVPYKVFLWNRETSLSIGGNHNAKLKSDAGKDLDLLPAKLSHKVFANLRYSSETKYLEETDLWKPLFGTKPIKVFNSDSLIATAINDNDYENDYYYGNYDSVVTYNDKYEILTQNNYEEEETQIGGVDVPKQYKYMVNMPFGKGPILKFDSNGLPIYTEGSNDNLMVLDPVRIKYKSTPHAIISFKSKGYEQPILPRLYSEEAFNIQNYYSEYSKSKVYSEINGIIEPSGGVIDFGGITVTGTSGDILTFDFLKYEFGQCGYSEENGKGVFTLNNNTEAYSEVIKKLSTNSFIFSTDIQVIKGVFQKVMNRIIPVVKIKYRDFNNQEKTGIAMISDFMHTNLNIVFKIIDIQNDTVFKSIIITGNSSITPSDFIVKRKFIYTNNDVYIYNGHKIYKENRLNLSLPQYPYLYIGEIYKPNIQYKTLYGGYSESAIQNIKWQICSSNTNIEHPIDITWGDTYYQRWDCLKTYPFTEEDTNSIVDILSFMVETHINIDGRCDSNRGISNFLNARPTNWNLLNRAYTQANNILEYNILDTKFDLSKFKNQITWSLTKLDTNNVDTWTNINLTNILSLDGTKGALTKLINVNDSVIALQDKAISSINFNNRTQLSTEQGTPVEIANSGKVDGYTIVTDNVGCINKWSVCKTSSGVYFMDDLNKSFMSFSKNGIENVGIKYGMSKFFKNNSLIKSWIPGNNAIRVSYDALTQDVYINSDKYSLLFNEKLGAFTSFMPYEGFSDMFAFEGYSFALKPINSTTKLFKMFQLPYNINADNEFTPYHITYKVNPEPFIDKVFTNIEYVADEYLTSTKVDEPEILSQTNPFNELRVWNEYQFGSCRLSEQVMPSDLKKKFRIWRANIPRDEKSKFKLDRIRNPWCYISLINNPNSTNKMVFHQIDVKYFK